MARYVVDARTLVHVVEAGVAVGAGHQLVAPNSVRSQALGLLYERVERGELAEAEALRLHEALTGVRMRLLGDRVSRRTAWRIARERGWGAEALADAEYLAVARLQADALVTVDAALARRAAGVVPVLTSVEVLGAPPAVR